MIILRKFRFKLGLAVLTASLLFCNFNVYAKEKKIEPQPVWVTAEEGLNIRTVPREKGNKPITAVEYGTQLDYIASSCAKGWAIILYEGKKHYVSEEWISFEELVRAGAVESDFIPAPAQEEAEEIISESSPIPDTPAAANSGAYFYATCFITHYCPCSICCGSYASGYTANGSYATPNWTVASGPDLPFGTKLLINGQVYEVQDRGVGSGCIDIFCSSHEEALARGAYYTDVYIID